jgi:hypothetical protein
MRSASSLKARFLGLLNFHLLKSVAKGRTPEQSFHSLRHKEDGKDQIKETILSMAKHQFKPL